MKNVDKKKKWVNILLFINFLSAIGIPCLGNFIDKITVYYFIISIISFIIIVLITKKVIIRGFIKYICAYYLILIISTMMNHQPLYSILGEAALVLPTMIIWYSFDRKNFKKYLPTIVLVLEILTYINFLMIIIFPEGLYNQGFIRKYYLFGHINITFRYLLPGCCFNMIRSYLYNEKLDKRCILYLLVVLLTLIINWPVTAIIGVIVFFICFFASNKHLKVQKILKPINSLVITAGVTISMLTFKIQNIFAIIISNIFHKEATLSGRINIWNTALYYIKDKLVLGYGRLSIDARNLYFNATSAHNQFLIFLFEGGIILMALIIVIFIKISKNLKESNNIEINSIIISTIASYSIMWIAEPFSYSGTLLMFLVWMLAYRSEYLFNIDRK